MHELRLLNASHSHHATRAALPLWAILLSILVLQAAVVIGLGLVAFV